MKMKRQRIRFTASKAPAAVAAYAALTAAYGQADSRSADVIVALGGDGFMLQTLHAAHGQRLPVYGMNCGTIGFLMNAYAVEDLRERLAAAEETEINPLAMRAVNAKGKVTEALAINEVSLLRQGRRRPSCRCRLMGGRGWRNWSATGRWWRHLRGPRPTTIRRMVRSCPSGRMFWR